MGMLEPNCVKSGYSRNTHFGGCMISGCKCRSLKVKIKVSLKDGKRDIK